jgi:hypothetical protein
MSIAERGHETWFDEGHLPLAVVVDLKAVAVVFGAWYKQQLASITIRANVNFHPLHALQVIPFNDILAKRDVDGLFVLADLDNRSIQFCPAGILLDFLKCHSVTSALPS